MAFHPHFLFGAPKRLRPQACAGGNRREAAALGRRLNDGGAAKRKSALPPGGMRVVTVLLSWGKPLRNHGRGAYQTSAPSTPCCTLPSSGKDRIDQLLFPRSPLRSALPGWSRPVAETTAPPLPCGELNPAGKGTNSHVASLLGMTENFCHCEEAQQADAAIRLPRPPQAKGSLVQRELSPNGRLRDCR